MNQDLCLLLELLDRGPWGFRFQLLVRNQSPFKFLLPFPDIIGLHFKAANSDHEAESYTSLFVSSDRSGFALDPAGSRVFQWKVRPCSIAPPESSEDRYDYYRWCVELKPGEYDVWYRWRVDDEYFDPDSHMRLKDLKNYAAREQAIAWQGETTSNRLRVIAM